MSNSKHFVVPVKRPSNDQNNMPVITPGSTSTSPLQLSFSDWLATPYQLGFSAWLKSKETVISETKPPRSSRLAAGSIIHQIKQPKPPNQPDNTIPNVTELTKTNSSSCKTKPSSSSVLTKPLNRSVMTKPPSSTGHNKPPCIKTPISELTFSPVSNSLSKCATRKTKPPSSTDLKKPTSLTHASSIGFIKPVKSRGLANATNSVVVKSPVTGAVKKPPSQKKSFTSTGLTISLVSNNSTSIANSTTSIDTSKPHIPPDLTKSPTITSDDLTKPPIKKPSKPNSPFMMFYQTETKKLERSGLTGDACRQQVMGNWAALDSGRKKKLESLYAKNKVKYEANLLKYEEKCKSHVAKLSKPTAAKIRARKKQTIPSFELPENSFLKLRTSEDPNPKRSELSLQPSRNLVEVSSHLNPIKIDSITLKLRSDQLPETINSNNLVDQLAQSNITENASFGIKDSSEPEVFDLAEPRDSDNENAIQVDQLEQSNLQENASFVITNASERQVLDWAEPSDTDDEKKEKAENVKQHYSGILIERKELSDNDETAGTEENKELKCECGLKFSKLGWLLRHMKQCSILFECDLCNKRFKNAKILLKHKTLMHIKLLACDQCDNSFTTPKKLERHVRFAHEASIKCEHCDLVLKNKNSFRKHRKGCYEKQQKIKAIGKHANVKQKLVKESRIGEVSKETNEPQRALEREDNNTNESTAIKAYQCELCPKRFAHDSGLRRHKKLHRQIIEQDHKVQSKDSNDNSIIIEGEELLVSATDATEEDLENYQVVILDENNKQVGTFLGSVPSRDVSSIERTLEFIDRNENENSMIKDTEDNPKKEEVCQEQFNIKVCQEEVIIFVEGEEVDIGSIAGLISGPQ